MMKPAVPADVRSEFSFSLRGGGQYEETRGNPFVKIIGVSSRPAPLSLRCLLHLINPLDWSIIKKNKHVFVAQYMHVVWCYFMQGLVSF